MVCAIFWDGDVSFTASSLLRVKGTHAQANIPLELPAAQWLVRQTSSASDPRAVQETTLEDGKGNKIRDANIISFKAYLLVSPTDSLRQAKMRSELQGSGISLIDTPESGRKNTTDFMLAADMVAFAIDIPPPARIFLISGDRDFAYGLGILRNK